MNGGAAVATLTMNPALDIATAVDRVTATSKLRCDAPRYYPGGGGINVARVIHSHGGKAIAVYAAGGHAGETIQALLQANGLPQRVVPVAGQTRESITVDERATGQQFRFVLPGPALSTSEQERCLEALAALEPPPDFVVVSGSLPPGVPAHFTARVAQQVKAMGAKLILDTSGEPLRHAVCEGAYLIKPNLRELSQLVGRELAEEGDQIAAGRQILEQDHAEAVVLSLGAEGALLITAEGVERFAALDVPLKSAVGAGDSMVGGITLALARGNPFKDAVAFGMAAGAAALMTEGTELSRREDTERLYLSLRAEAG